MQTIIGDLIDKPVGTEIFLVVVTLFVFTLSLWLMSKAFKFRKQNLTTAFLVSIISAGVPFLIRLTGVLMLAYPRFVITNKIAMWVEPLLLLISTKTAYSRKWGKAALTSFIVYIMKWVILGYLTVLIIITLTDIPQKYLEEQKWKDISLAQSMVDFKILEPTYIPEGYRLMSIKPAVSSNGEYSRDLVVLSYGTGGSVVSLHERLRKNPVNFTNDYPKGGEPVIINGKLGMYYEHSGGHNQPYLTWYDEETNMEFGVFDSIGNELSKEDLIKIAESIT